MQSFVQQNGQAVPSQTPTFYSPYSLSDVVFLLASLTLTGLSIVAFVDERDGSVGAMLLFTACTIFFTLRPLASSVDYVEETVEFDEHSICRLRRNRAVEEIPWADVDEIGIVTTDEGPAVCDCCWLFVNADRTNGVAISNDTGGLPMLLTQIQELPGFDNEGVIEAMGCVTNNSFRIWKRAARLGTEQATESGV